MSNNYYKNRGNDNYNNYQRREADQSKGEIYNQNNSYKRRDKGNEEIDYKYNRNSEGGCNKSNRNKQNEYNSKYVNESRRNKTRRRSSYSESKSKSRSKSRSRSRSRKRSEKYSKINQSQSKTQRERNKHSSSRSSSRSRSKSSSSSYKAIKKSSYPSSKDNHQNKFQQRSTNEFNTQISEQQPQQNPYDSLLKGKELSNTLMISSLGPDINLHIIEDVFREKCLEFQTSMPEDFRFIESIRVAYIIFPSTPVAALIYESLGGTISINGNYYTLEFMPGLSNNPYNNISNKTSVTYVTSVTDNSAFTTSMETTVHEDWICEFCDCKNFSKRTVCFKCKRAKTLNCRIIPVIKQKTTVMGEGGQVPPSTSLLIRGNIVKETNETELLEIFSFYGQVKDIRMVCDKITGEPKDYAFVEYFTIDESTMALNQIKRNPVKLRGNPIFVTFSKIRRPEDYADSSRINLSSKQVDYDSMMPPIQVLNNPAIYPGDNSAYHQIGNLSTMNTMKAMSPMSNILNSIKMSNLSLEEQSKLKNISEIQNLILNTQNQVSSFQSNDIRGETNLRREKEITEREKVELEMKKWKKVQNKIERKKTEENEIKNLSLKNALNDYDITSKDAAGVENEYESVISISAAKDKIVALGINVGPGVVRGENVNVTTSTSTSFKHIEQENVIDSFNPAAANVNIQEGFICYICQRKFPTEEKLKIHENMSNFHKENLKKMSTTKL